MPNYIQPEDYGTFEEGGVGGGEESLRNLMMDYGWGSHADDYQSLGDVQAEHSGSLVSLSTRAGDEQWGNKRTSGSRTYYTHDESVPFYEFDEKTQQGIDRILSSMQEYDSFQEDLATSSAISDINVGESMIRSTANEAISAMGQTMEGLGRSGLAGSGAGRELLENFRGTYGEKVGGMTSGLRQTGIGHKSDVAQSRQQYRDDIWNLFSKWVQGDPEQAKEDTAYIYHQNPNYIDPESEDTGGGD